MSSAHFVRGPAYGLSAEVKSKVGPQDWPGVLLPPAGPWGGTWGLGDDTGVHGAVGGGQAGVVAGPSSDWSQGLRIGPVHS